MTKQSPFVRREPRFLSSSRTSPSPPARSVRGERRRPLARRLPVSMFTGASGSAASYNVKDQARSLTALEGDTDRNRFVVGSLDLRGDNEVRKRMPLFALCGRFSHIFFSAHSCTSWSLTRTPTKCGARIFLRTRRRFGTACHAQRRSTLSSCAQPFRRARSFNRSCGAWTAWRMRRQWPTPPGRPRRRSPRL